MNQLWNKEAEKNFFLNALNKFSTPEQLFYRDNKGRYLAYWPKKYQGHKNTLQSRNSLIGRYTETWTANLLEGVVESMGCFVVPGAVCKELALPPQSNADVVVSKTKRVKQDPRDILLICEVKMSIVWNWEYKPKSGELINLGDYTSHQGNPGMLRSDSMLKAIGKSLNIRVSNAKANGIPIIVLGNTPINKSYFSKVDHLKKAGIVQGFWSLNPSPLEDERNIKCTEQKGFCRIDTKDELRNNIRKLLETELTFFSSMKNSKEIGRLVQLADRKTSLEEKGKEFIRLLNKS